MRRVQVWKHMLLSLLLTVGIFAVIGPSFVAHGVEYWLAAFPIYSQEGSTITIVLSASGALPSAQYEFDFLVRDPSGAVWTSNHQKSPPGVTSFNIILLYPGPDFPVGASTSLVATSSPYIVSVNQINPVPQSNVAGTLFWIGLTDKTSYQRTGTVSIVATEYSPLENVVINIRTSTSSTLVYSNSIFADSTGVLSDSWKIPKDTTTAEDYVVTLQGTTTFKSPADAQGFSVLPAQMSIQTISSSKTTYPRTDTFSFSFQAIYPSGETANTGLGLVILTRPDRANKTLTAAFDNNAQVFAATDKTTADNQTGPWTASLPHDGFDDGYGNTGPGTVLTTSTQLQPATFSINMVMKASFAASEQIKFNATITYPDGTPLATGSVAATLAQTGGAYTSQVPVVYDSSLNLWIGIYSPRGDEPSGLWSLNVTAFDNAQPSNSGSSVKALQIANRAPLATFTGSANNVLTGVAVTFDSTSSYDPDGVIVTTLWDFGDGSTGSGAVTSHSYANPGTYTVRLTVTDNLGAAQSTTYTVAVTSPTQSGGNVSLPLYYFAIAAALIAAFLAGGFMLFRRHKVTHTKLRIDLEAVRTEAGRIENQQFFQSVKEQLKKDKDD